MMSVCLSYCRDRSGHLELREMLREPKSGFYLSGPVFDFTT